MVETLSYPQKTATAFKGGYMRLDMMANKGVTITSCQNYYVPAITVGGMI